MSSPGRLAQIQRRQSTDSMEEVANILSRLQQDVDALKDRLPGAMTPTPGGDLSSYPTTPCTPREGRSSEFVDGDGAQSEVGIRPSIYPHGPQSRRDALEQHDFHETDLLDSLKLPTFQGFYNLSALLLVFSIGYIVTRNVTERGLFLRWEDFVCGPVQRDVAWTAAMLVVAVAVSLGILLIQRGFIAGYIGGVTLLVLYVLDQALLLAIPVGVSYATPIAPLYSAGTLLVVLIMMLKNHSYIATNYALFQEQRHLLESKETGRSPVPSTVGPAEESTTQRPTLRQRQRSDSAGSGNSAPEDPRDTTDPRRSVSESHGDEEHEENEEDAMSTEEQERSDRQGEVGGPGAKEEDDEGREVAGVGPVQLMKGGRKRRRKAVLSFPSNVTLRDFLYFLLAPSLVYEPCFPRLKRARRWGYILTRLAEGVLFMFIQYFIVAQFMLPVLRRVDGTPLWYAMMKLAIPSFLLWLVMFYVTFHCALNVMAELLLFADREFFREWWNATSLDKFWRDWNRPVHEWCLRHIYVESMHYGHVSKRAATFITFLLSAVLHELLFSVAFKTARPWFFLGMMAQVPLILVGRSFRGTRRGNYLVWLSLFSGQPLLEVLYFRECVLVCMQLIGSQSG